MQKKHLIGYSGIVAGALLPARIHAFMCTQGPYGFFDACGFGIETFTVAIGLSVVTIIFFLFLLARLFHEKFKPTKYTWERMIVFLVVLLLTIALWISLGSAGWETPLDIFSFSM